MHPRLSETRFSLDVAGITPELCEMRSWTLFKAVFPTLDIGFSAASGATMRLRLHCENWNEVPPAIDLLAFDGTLLDALPAGLSSIFNPSRHFQTQRPFICMRGSREYHTHESHRTDPWDDLKRQSGYRLGEIVTQIWSGWKRTNP